MPFSSASKFNIFFQSISSDSEMFFRLLCIGNKSLSCVDVNFDNGSSHMWQDQRLSLAVFVFI